MSADRTKTTATSARAGKRPILDLARFVKECGVEIVDCSPEWGGRYAYRQDVEAKRDGISTTTVCGFRTANAAMRAWLNDPETTGISKQLLHHLKVKVV